MTKAPRLLASMTRLRPRMAGLRPTAAPPRPGPPARPTLARRRAAATLALATLALAALALPAMAGCADPEEGNRSGLHGGPAGTPGTDGSGPGPSAPAAATPKPTAALPGMPPVAGGSARSRGTADIAVWRHRAGLTWQWQLDGPLDIRVDADVYEVDGFTTPASTVSRLHDGGRRVICYISAGAYEEFRPDAGRFPRTLLGRENGWPGERWLDIRRWEALEPILRERFEMCRDKGFDAVEADNVDGYANDSGFPLTAADQLDFNRKLARMAHSLGLAIGLKNDLGQVAALEPDFDFAVNEECFRYRECGQLSPFIRAGKPVFHVEYDLPPEQFCGQARELGMTSMVKHDGLDLWRHHC